MKITPLLISAAIDLDGPSRRAQAIDSAELVRLARFADDAGIDFLVLGQDAASIVAGWLISATQSVGLVPMVSAIFAQPFHTARALSAMDFLSNGRMGWLPYLAGHAEHAAQFGSAPPLATDEADAKAAEFVAATEALWDSWDADALVIDKVSGLYLHSEKIRRVDFRGTYFRVMGPLNAARPPQGHPVRVQDDCDPPGRGFAGRADVCLVGAGNLDDARRQTQALRDAGAQRRLLKVIYGPYELGAEDAMAVAGDPSGIADSLEEWAWAGCDGFHILANSGPEGLCHFFGQVMPELRRRGLIAVSEPGRTLRQRLGLPVPANPYDASR